MSLTFRTSLIFGFAVACVAAAISSETLSKIQADRSPFLELLSRLDASVESARLTIAHEINNLLEMPGRTPTFYARIPTPEEQIQWWTDLLLGTAKFPFNEGEEHLTPQMVGDRMVAYVDRTLPAATSLAKYSDEAVAEEYFKDLFHVLREAERLATMELVHQFMKAVAGKQDAKLEFDAASFARLADKITAKGNELVDARQVSFADQKKKAEDSLEASKKRIRDELLPSLRKLLSLCINSVAAAKAELQALVIAASQSGKEADPKVIVAKFEYLANLLGQLALKHLDSEEERSGLFKSLFDTFGDFVEASRAGSSSGSSRFKEMVPAIIGRFIQAAHTYASHETGFELARKYLVLLCNRLSAPGIDEWFAEFAADAANLPDVSDPNADDFEVQALRATDIIKRVPFQSVAKWWSTAEPQFVAILESISGEALALMEAIKPTACKPMESADKKATGYRDFPEFFAGYYRLLTQTIAEQGAAFGSQNGWPLRFDATLNRLLATDPFVKKWYLLIKVQTLLRRENVQGTSPVGDFLSANPTFAQDLTAQLKSNPDLITKFFKKLFDFAREQNKSIKRNKALFESLSWVGELANKDIPLEHYAIVQKTTEVGTKKIDDDSNFNLAHKSVAVGFKDAEGKLAMKDVQKEKTPAKEPTPVKKEQAPIKEPSPVKKEQTPVKEPSPIKKEPTPIKEPTPKKEQTPVKEKTPAEDNAAKKLDDGLGAFGPVQKVDEQPDNNKIQVVEDLPADKQEDDQDLPADKQPNTNQQQNAKESQPLVHDIDEEHQTPRKEGTPIKISEEPLAKVEVPELENLIEVLKGQLDPAVLQALRVAPDLIDLVERIQVEVDPETGDETHYHYIQVVPKDSACYESIFE